MFNEPILLSKKHIYIWLLHNNDISANLNDFLFHKNTARLSYIHCAIDKETNQQ